MTMWSSVLSYLAPTQSPLPQTYRAPAKVAPDLEAAAAIQAAEAESLEADLLVEASFPGPRRRTGPGSDDAAPSPLGKAAPAAVQVVAVAAPPSPLGSREAPPAHQAVPLPADGGLLLPPHAALQPAQPAVPPLQLCGKQANPGAVALKVTLQELGAFDATAEVHHAGQVNGMHCKPPPGPNHARKPLGAAAALQQQQRIPPNGALGGLFGPGLFRHDSFPPYDPTAVPKDGIKPSRGLSMPASPSLPAGPPTAQFDELRFVQQIGEGGFGKVYYGYWGEQRVAIKLATPQPQQDMDQMVHEFQREVAAMSSVPPHPNVLRLIAACTAPPRLALVTEYCAAGSLYNLLHSPRPSNHSWPHLLNICLGVAHGMAHLHNHHVLHRDLKSSNILLDPSGTKIADFGLARVYRGKQALTGGLGTYQWMAPEVLAHQRYSEKADVYSFGIILWECAARQLPYQGMTAVQAAVGVVTHGLRPEIPKGTPPDVAALVKECWAAVPEQRPTMEQAAQHLARILEVIRGCPTHR